MTKEEAVLVSALIGALAAIFTTSLGLWINHGISKRTRGDELLSTALAYLGGGSQRRNLGVATLSIYWRDHPKHNKLIGEMLVGTAIYLLRESKQKDSSHEIFNLFRIMQLINEMPNRTTWAARLKYELEKLISNFLEKPQKGIWVDKKQLIDWREKFNS